MKKYLLILTTLFFIGCGDSEEIANFLAGIDENKTQEESNSEISEADKLAKNPNFELYNDNCEQDSNPALCGYSPKVGSESEETAPPSFPCQDKTYCLPEEE